MSETRVKKIRYATPEGEEEAAIPAPKDRLLYHNRGVPWRESEDNPLSPNFIPLTERSERARMRWWAQQQRRKKNTIAAGVFDA